MAVRTRQKGEKVIEDGEARGGGGDAQNDTAGWRRTRRRAGMRGGEFVEETGQHCVSGEEAVERWRGGGDLLRQAMR